MIVLAIILLAIGLFLTIKPTLVWKFTESWKSYSDGDPSDLYLLNTRIGGIVFLGMGIATIVLLFFI